MIVSPGSGGINMETVSFTRMEDGSREDYLLLDRLESEHIAGARRVD